MLKYILLTYGYIDCKPMRPVPYFYVQDHQGNNRVVLDKNDSIMQVNHYYPFGALFGKAPANANRLPSFNFILSGTRRNFFSH